MKFHRASRLATLILCCCVMEPADVRAADDWPRFLGPHANSSSDETGLLLDWPAGGPPILWHKEIGEGYAVPSIADGRLFLFDRVANEARLSALDPETGKELWRSTYPTSYVDAFEYSGGPRTAPLVDGDRVYAFGVDGRLRCHKVTDGTVLWEVDTEERWGVVQNFFGVASSPVIDGPRLIVPVGGSPEGEWDIHQGKVDSNGSGLVAFDKMTGKVLYEKLDELASYSSPIIVELGGKKRGLWWSRDNFVIFDPATGEPETRWPLRAKRVYSVNASTPIVVGNRIFLSESYEKGGVLLDWSEEGLEIVWHDAAKRKDQSMATHWNTAIYHDDTLYGSSGEKSGSAELRAVDWRTGEILWSVPGLNRATLLSADGHLFVLTEYGQLLLLELDREEPRIKEKVTIEAEIDGRRRALVRHPSWGAPVLANGILYLRGKDRLVALDLRKR